MRLLVLTVGNPLHLFRNSKFLLVLKTMSMPPTDSCPFFSPPAGAPELPLPFILVPLTPPSSRIVPAITVILGVTIVGGRITQRESTIDFLTWRGFLSANLAKYLVMGVLFDWYAPFGFPSLSVDVASDGFSSQQQVFSPVTFLSLVAPSLAHSLSIFASRFTSPRKLYCTGCYVSIQVSPQPLISFVFYLLLSAFHSMID